MSKQKASEDNPKVGFDGELPLGAAERIPERRKPDPELQAMARIDRLLSTLTPEQKRRVIMWACQREVGNFSLNRVMPEMPQ